MVASDVSLLASNENPKTGVANVADRPIGLSSLNVGDSACFDRRIDTSDIDAFANLSGDENSLHMDSAGARLRGFRDRVVHGALLAALVSRLVGMHLPGERGLMLSLRLDFAAPSYPGDTLRITGTVSGIHPAERAAVIRITVACADQLRARGSVMVRVE